jgi:hypothetical protein
LRRVAFVTAFVLALGALEWPLWRVFTESRVWSAATSVAVVAILVTAVVRLAILIGLRACRVAMVGIALRMLVVVFMSAALAWAVVSATGPIVAVAVPAESSRLFFVFAIPRAVVATLVDGAAEAVITGVGLIYLLVRVRRGSNGLTPSRRNGAGA